MSLMGSLYLGVSGLQTSNNALNTTAHNMSNLDTLGYTRQQVAQATRTYITINKSQSTSWQQLGLGVTYSQTRQV
ncbi:MAG: flagellar basal body protein, partial [Bacillus sp. (in: Bacteria)]|nr:flagellar basal body protein [Bacillus sp. (in: firmicutes)]